MEPLNLPLRTFSLRLCNLFRDFETRLQTPSMASALIISLIIFSLLSLSSTLPTDSVLNAAEILSDNGFVSMALTLELVAESLLSQSSSLTIFSPPDTVFAQSGQPSLSLLQFHFLPAYLSPQSLKSLASGSKIPTMLADRSLFVTSLQSDPQITLNRVEISSFPLFDDGSLIVFGIDKFFDLEFKVPPPTQSPGAEFGCAQSTKNPFDEAIRALRSNGYSWMALFLASQIPEAKNNQSRISVFAPSDEAMVTRIGNFSEYPSLYFRHILPCRMLWNDLVDFEEALEIPTYMEGYAISITRSGGTLMVNRAAVFYPDMYFNEWLVVHGLRDFFAVAEESDSSTNLASTTQEMVLGQNHW